MTEDSKDLVIGGSGDSPFGEGYQPEELVQSMELEEAKKLLEYFIANSENQVHEKGDFDLGQYSVKDLSRASLSVALDLIKNRKHEVIEDTTSYSSTRSEYLRKKANKTRITLDLFYDSTYTVGHVFNPAILTFTTESTTQNAEMSHNFSPSWNFSYSGKGGVTYIDTSLGTIPKSDQEYAFLVRGMRWMFRNMLDWDVSYTTPEQMGINRIPESSESK